ncbi:hypothetical protein P8C59_007411 [Phyllachora maydis]|uniref:Uncharacterized protein n=1 Tax=Phyllachora maydis TaxID=1825666 RepID=A0AAD9I9H0_9PEZI|nr:hypothetical protein P8C59_007411 [Phyllachora maydis]
MLSRLPSKIAFGLLEVDLDGHGTIQIPRRELWDVRVQLMAEEDELEQGAELEPGLGKHDVKTGIYEGGFKSWESSVDLVKVLASEGAASALSQASSWMIELGCGTALPSLAMFHFTETLLAILRKERDTTPDGQAAAMVAAKRVYFGVGGSLDDFVSKMQNLGPVMHTLTR